MTENAKRNKGRATIRAIGQFDGAGFPINWEFDRPARKRTTADGSYTFAGYTSAELLKLRQFFEETNRVPDMADVINLLDEKAPRKPSKVKADDASDPLAVQNAAAALKDELAGQLQLEAVNDQGDVAEHKEPVLPTAAADRKPSPPDLRTPMEPAKIFKFEAVITGVSAKKPPKLRAHKEVKLLSPDLGLLQEIDGYLDKDVLVLIVPRNRSAAELIDRFMDDETFGDEDETFGDEDEIRYYGDPTDAADAEALRENEIDETAEKPKAWIKWIKDANGKEIAVPADAPTAEHEDAPLPPDLRIDDPADHTPVDEGEQKVTPVCAACGGEIIDNPDFPGQMICAICNTVCEIDALTEAATESTDDLNNMDF